MTTPTNEPPRMQPLNGPPDLRRYDVPHTAPFACELTVTPDLLSRAIPHVSNIEYVRWLDRAAELHSDHVGWTRRRMLNGGMMWFVARHEIDYLAETWQNDRILIATWVRQFDRIKSWRDSIIVRPADEAVVARASTLWVLVDLERRRPRRVPADMAASFVPLQSECRSAERASAPCTSE